MSDFPEIVFKYRDWNNGFHKSILLHNELYLASPKDINDPFDCRIPSNYSLLSDTEKKEYIDKVHIREFPFLQSRNINVEQSIREIEARMNDLKTFQAENEKVTFEMQDKFYGILSLSSRWDSILMWSHYAASHTGFCVGFHEARLRESGLFGKGGNVQYETNFPEIKPDAEMKQDTLVKQAFVVTHSKAEDWEYEDEYRLIKTFDPDDDNIPEPFERVITIADNFFSEVILGINISESNKKEISKLCFKKGIPIYQAKKVPFKFEITKELIPTES